MLFYRLETQFAKAVEIRQLQQLDQLMNGLLFHGAERVPLSDDALNEAITRKAGHLPLTESSNSIYI